MTRIAFICDVDGRLITRGAPGDRLTEFDDALRLAPDALPAEITGALADPKQRFVGDGAPLASSHFQHGGNEYLTTFSALPGDRDWLVGIVVPRDFYLGKLSAMRDRSLVVSLGIMVVLVGGGSVILRRRLGWCLRSYREIAVQRHYFIWHPAVRVTANNS